MEDSRVELLQEPTCYSKAVLVDGSYASASMEFSGIGLESTEQTTDNAAAFSHHSFERQESLHGFPAETVTVDILA